jgi:hypothetical protein
LAEALTTDNHFDELPLQRVSLSETGVAFVTEALIPVGTAMRIRFIIRPTHQIVQAYAKVVYSAEKDNVIKTAVHFEQMQNTDRTLLARHILYQQTLKKREAQ